MEEAGERQAPGELWCARCGKRAAEAGGTAVHAATGSRTGPDGHPVAPVPCEPPLWHAAREIAADYAGVFDVSARFGILRADWSLRALSPGVTAGHYEAHDEAELRRILRQATAGTPWERPADGTGR